MNTSRLEDVERPSVKPCCEGEIIFLKLARFETVVEANNIFEMSCVDSIVIKDSNRVKPQC